MHCKCGCSSDGEGSAPRSRANTPSLTPRTSSRWLANHKHTLEDLHHVIQKAFDFANDHLYSFFLDAKNYSKQSYHSPMSDDGPFADEVTIGEFRLYEGQRIL